MARCYLFGPVTADFADRYLHEARQKGDVLAFNATGTGVDLRIATDDTWADIAARFPAGWQPDFIVLWLPYTTTPACLWSAPVPLIGLAADWNLLWHGYRRVLRHCELVFTDTVGVESLHREGIEHARFGNLYGLSREWTTDVVEDTARDIDLLFIGNLHPAVQRERLSWLGRLARLSGRWNVVIRSQVFGQEYRSLLRRSRIVFNRSIRGECNQRAFEAAAAGALLFQEAGNREVPSYFRDRQECVEYEDDSLETLLEYYLSHEEERSRIANAARLRVQEYRFADLWEVMLDQIEHELPVLQERQAQRPVWSAQATQSARLWQWLGSAERVPDAALLTEISTALKEQPRQAALHNALGVARMRVQPGVSEALTQAIDAFRQAYACAPDHLLAGLNLAEALVTAGRAREALEPCRCMLAALERSSRLGADVLDAPHFPVTFDLFRVEWERAAWHHTGRPAMEAEAKRRLLRWRLHTLLAELTGDLMHFQEATLARPDLPTTQAALGCALGRAGRANLAIPHLRQAVTDNPFDAPAARALYQALVDTGARAEARHLAQERRFLAQAIPQAVPAEDWFQQAPPVGEELASILILCCNEVAYTKLCLESIFQHTRPPYELILVNNGSTDDTAAYLDELHTRSGPVRVEVIHNATNVGFPAGCNQALAQAQGRYIVFLNNDTVVTAGWLEDLIDVAWQCGPRMGLIGPVTNYSRPPQQIAVDYTDLQDLPAFAARRKQAWAGKTLAVERLTGFCLLARRELLEQIGGFDEQYGLGFFDDDDLSVRALKADFRLLVAQDVYVHHFGSRTFTALGVACQEQLRQNFERFHAKWGAEHSAGYRLPAASERQQATNTPSTSHLQIHNGSMRSRPRVSLCMIVKNEADNLPACLESVAGVMDEMIIVDTGSTDATKDIATRMGARVFDFAWIDHFAAARNECLRHATGEWIFWLDADDRLDADNRERLRHHLAGLGSEKAAYVMKCICLPDPRTTTTTVVDHVRLFRHEPGVRWEHRVHEQILPSLRRLGHETRWCDVVIQHTGYVDAALRRRKLERDLRLLHLEQQEQPHHPFTLFNLGLVYQDLGHHTEAVQYLRASLDRSQPSDSIVRKLYALLAGCYRHLRQPAEALALCAEGLRVCPDDTELLFLRALLRLEGGNLSQAEADLLHLLTARPAEHFASVAAGLRGYQARQNLGVVYRRQGRNTEAEEQWRAVVAERPEFVSGWEGLAELYIEQQRWSEVAEVIAHLQAVGATQAATLLRARELLSQRAFQAARTLLESVLQEQPGLLGAQVVLSHVLLQEGQDLEAAERVLRAILQADPEHAQARQNLSVLLRQRGHSTEPSWTIVEEPFVANGDTSVRNRSTDELGATTTRRARVPLG